MAVGFGIALMIGSQALCNYTLLSWGPAFFERVHGWPRNEIGLTLGIITLTSGCLGLIIGGRLADRWQRQEVTDGTLRVGLISLIGVGILLPTAMLHARSALDRRDARDRCRVHRLADRLVIRGSPVHLPESDARRGVGHCAVYC